uniref:Rod shape-determining protein MreD n=2 Tax=Caenorhabditis tropicalis TaxID=1561998 RepID=A0A1I7UKX3_9PELO
MRKRVSAFNFKRHKAAVHSLMAQFIASTVLLIPPLTYMFVSTNGSSQIAIQSILAVFSLRSTVNATVLVATTPPYRRFLLRCQMSEIDFSEPRWLILYYRIIGFSSLLLNTLGFYLLVFQNSKLGNFRFYLIGLQVACTFTDIHLSLLMQPVPLYPLLAGYTVGLLSKYFGVSAHVCAMITGFVALIQLESLTLCFGKNIKLSRKF